MDGLWEQNVLRCAVLHVDSKFDPFSALYAQSDPGQVRGLLGVRWSLRLARLRARSCA